MSAASSPTPHTRPRTGSASTGSSPAPAGPACGSSSTCRPSATTSSIATSWPTAGTTTACRARTARRSTTGPSTPIAPRLAGEWEDFLDFVTARVNTVNGVRYRDDATIAVISIAGEPMPPGSEECGKATTTTGLTDFYQRTLGYLASIDANHLRSTGGLIHLDWQQLYGGSSGIDGQAIFALAANTLPSLHTYPPQYAGGRDADRPHDAGVRPARRLARQALVHRGVRLDAVGRRRRAGRTLRLAVRRAGRRTAPTARCSGTSASRRPAAATT